MILNVRSNKTNLHCGGAIKVVSPLWGLFLWRLILQDALATETIMLYNNSEISQGYNIIEKSRRHKGVSFNGIKLIVQE